MKLNFHREVAEKLCALNFIYGLNEQLNQNNKED